MLREYEHICEILTHWLIRALLQDIPLEKETALLRTIKSEFIDASLMSRTNS